MMAGARPAAHALTLALLVPAALGAQRAGTAACAGSPATAEPFAPALADSGRIYRGSFAPNGREFYFFRKMGDDPRAEDYRIFVSRLRSSGWGPPERVMLGADASDLYPTISADGRRMVFTSYRRPPGDTASKPNAGLWYSDRRGTGWTTPGFIAGATRIGAYHAHPLLAPDGRLFFNRTSPGWDTTTTLVAPRRGADYGEGEPYAPVERWRGWRADLLVWGGWPGPDSSFVLLEVSARDPARHRAGPSDLWASLRRGQEWTEPAPLGARVNTPGGWENFATLSPDGCDLVFVRDFSAFYRVSLQAALGQSP